jgi:hypothetical protein
MRLRLKRDIKTPPNMSVLNSTPPSAAMEQVPRFYCHDCGNRKLKEQFELRKRSDKYGVQGDPTSSCSSCAAKRRHRRENKKRKRDEEGPDPSRAPVQSITTISMAQFTAALRKEAVADDLCFSALVSTQGLVGDTNEIGRAIAARVWEATGFRFTYG